MTMTAATASPTTATVPVPPKGTKPPAASATKAATPATAKPATVEDGLKAIGFMLPLALIELGDNASRVYEEPKESVDAFAKGIKSDGGIIQPLVVTPRNAKTGKYTLLDGFRRFAAAKVLGLKEVPVTLWAADTGKVNLISNLRRKDLSKVEIALNIKRVAEENKWKLPHIHGKPKPGAQKGDYQVKEVATYLGVSSAYVTQACRLLLLPDNLLDQLHNEQIDETAAFAYENMPVGVREQVLAIATEIADAEKAARDKAKGKAPAAAGKGGSGKAAKVEPTAASKATLAAAKREREAKAKVTGKHMAKAAGQVAKSGGVSGDDATALGRAAMSTSTNSQVRSIADMDSVVSMLKGEGGKCDEFAATYQEWRIGEMESDSFAEWMKGLLIVADEN
jgi:ParB-like chromosome segregation protein Spo0J